MPKAFSKRKSLVLNSGKRIGNFKLFLIFQIFIYSEKKFENFLESVPKECLPKEYGGENSTVEEIKGKCKKPICFLV